ncbi:SDR family oxidoreductase, partial [Kibdelosporangium lantanae]
APEITARRYRRDELGEYVLHTGDRARLDADGYLYFLGRDDDMAGVAVFLASRAGSYLTGTIIPVDGGIATTASGT